jgi:hypothetical protein
MKNWTLAVHLSLCSTWETGQEERYLSAVLDNRHSVNYVFLLSAIFKILLRMRGFVTNNNRFRIGFIGSYVTIKTNYDRSQSMAACDSLHSLLDYERLLFHCDWLGSGLRIGHFFCFRWLTLHSWALNSLTNAECRITNELAFITRGEPKRDHYVQQCVYYCVYSLPREYAHPTVAYECSYSSQYLYVQVISYPSCHLCNLAFCPILSSRLFLSLI